MYTTVLKNRPIVIHHTALKLVRQFVNCSDQRRYDSICLISIFADTATYLPLKYMASAETMQSEDPQRLVASCINLSLYLKKKNRTRANTYYSSDLEQEIVKVMYNVLSHGYLI